MEKIPSGIVIVQTVFFTGQLLQLVGMAHRGGFEKVRVIVVWLRQAAVGSKFRLPFVPVSFYHAFTSWADGPMYEIMRRLHPRGMTSTGITVDPDGAMLGPDCVLVRPTIEGYRCIGHGEAAALQEFLFVDGAEPGWLFGQRIPIATSTMSA